MSAMIIALVALGIYARQFVIDGVMAKPEINLMIFGLAGFAAAIAFRHVMALKNEVVALKALQVDFGSRRRRPVNPYKNPAIVFHEPVLLGQGYRMISEELGKQDDLNISNSTVQTLLHDVDARINDRRSTIMYFSGLMVFLGLLGAFMGLMKTVHAVSDLIAAMDLSGSAGADGIAKMIEGMKAPLHGMSVGFSSSLFGLMTSMVLGALERCMTSAHKSLRNEFEHWLANVAALEAAGPQGDSAAKVETDFTLVKRALEMGGRQLKEVRDTVVAACESDSLTRNAIADMAHSVDQLSRSVHMLSDPRPLLAPIASAVGDLARNQMAMLTQFKGLYDQAEADRMHIRAMLETMERAEKRGSHLDGELLHRQIERLVALQADLAAREPIVLPAPVASTTAATPRGLFASLFGFTAAAASTGGESRAIRNDVRAGLLGQRRLLRQIAARLGRRLDRIEAGNAEDRDALSALMTSAADQQAKLEGLVQKLGDAAESEVYEGQSGLTGAREELEHLQRRLNAAIGTEDAPTTPPPAFGQSRASGTEG